VKVDASVLIGLSDNVLAKELADALESLMLLKTSRKVFFT
jgi:hypothetical protein